MAARRKSWSDTLRLYLARSGLTQQDVAFDLRVSPSTVSYWCRGSVPREQTRKRIESWSGGAVPSSTSA